MQSKLFMKKIVVVSLMVTPLVLGACSKKDEGGSADATSASASAKSSTGSASASASSQASSAAPGSSDSAAPNASGTPNASGAPAVPGANGAAAQPLDPTNPEFPKMTPIDGQPASEGDRAAIDGMVRGLLNQPTLRQFYGNMLNNTCSRVLEKNGGAAAYDLGSVPDLPMNSLDAVQQANASINSVDDVKVKGDEASASVTQTSNGETRTDTMRFLREGGNWKICD